MTYSDKHVRLVRYDRGEFYSGGPAIKKYLVKILIGRKFVAAMEV
jgi:hypothetical protein